MPQPFNLWLPDENPFIKALSPQIKIEDKGIKRYAKLAAKGATLGFVGSDVNAETIPEHLTEFAGSILPTVGLTAGAGAVLGATPKIGTVLKALSPTARNMAIAPLAGAAYGTGKGIAAGEDLAGIAKEAALEAAGFTVGEGIAMGGKAAYSKLRGLKKGAAAADAAPVRAADDVSDVIDYNLLESSPYRVRESAIDNSLRVMNPEQMLTNAEAMAMKINPIKSYSVQEAADRALGLFNKAKEPWPKQVWSESFESLTPGTLYDDIGKPLAGEPKYGLQNPVLNEMRSEMHHWNPETQMGGWTGELDPRLTPPVSMKEQNAARLEAMMAARKARADELRNVGSTWPPGRNLAYDEPRTIIDNFIETPENPSGILKEGIDLETGVRTLEPKTPEAAAAIDLAAQSPIKRVTGPTLLDEELESLSRPEIVAQASEIVTSREAGAVSNVLKLSDEEMEKLFDIKLISPGRYGVIEPTTNYKMIAAELDRLGIKDAEFKTIKKTIQPMFDNIKKEIESRGGSLTEKDAKNIRQRLYLEQLRKIRPC